MRILIVDDEPLARDALTNIVAARSDVEYCDTANDATEAFEKISRSSYDVLLLDINMSELSGLEFLDRLKEANLRVPVVVFITLFEERAVTAFARHGVDCLLKPFSAERLTEILDLAFERMAAETLARLAEVLPHLQGIPGFSTRIAIKGDGRILFIDPNDVVAVQAEGNYVLLQREAGSHLLRESISVMADKLKPYGFIRIHRSVLVNSAFVREIRPSSTGDYGLFLKSGREYTVTRTYKKNLKLIAASWIGTDAFSAQ